jgi:hypothetical protein
MEVSSKFIAEPAEEVSVDKALTTRLTHKKIPFDFEISFSVKACMSW